MAANQDSSSRITLSLLPRLRIGIGRSAMGSGLSRGEMPEKSGGWKQVGGENAEVLRLASIDTDLDLPGRTKLTRSSRVRQSSNA